MNQHTCTTCGQTIDHGDAVLRSVAFQLVAWHRECYAFDVLPAQQQRVPAFAYR